MFVFQPLGLQWAGHCSPRVEGSWKTPSNRVFCTSLAPAECLGPTKSSLHQLSLFGFFLDLSHTLPTEAGPSSLVMSPQMLLCVPSFDIRVLNQSRLLLAWICSQPWHLSAANKAPLITKAKSAPCLFVSILQLWTCPSGSAAFRPSFAACPSVYKGGISQLPAPS